MFTLLLALIAPAHALSPAGAGWASAGIAAGAGATMFTPGVFAYADIEPRISAPECGEFPDCEGYGAGLTFRAAVLGGAGSYGLSAAGAGALTHAITVKHGGWTVLAAGGATALVSTGLTVAGFGLAPTADTEVVVGLIGAGVLGNLIGVPLAVGLASSAETRSGAHPAAPVGPTLTGVGVAPMHDGAAVSLSASF